MNDTTPTALTFPTNLCSTHQSPSAACRLCNPAILDLEDEIAALREAVRVMGIDLRKLATNHDLYGPSRGRDNPWQAWIARDVLDNPIAAAALKEAGK